MSKPNNHNCRGFKLKKKKKKQRERTIMYTTFYNYKIQYLSILLCKTSVSSVSIIFKSSKPLEISTRFKSFPNDFIFFKYYIIIEKKT